MLRLARSLVTATIAISLGLACSTRSNQPAGAGSASFFVNPDVVWSGIEVTLDQLGYEITDSNRPDGKIRAESEDLGEGSGVVLIIDQVAWTNDQVKVYVKPLSQNPDAPATTAQFEAATRDFLAVLKRKLGG